MAEIVQLIETGEVRRLVGFDIETAPIPGLEGYPGARRATTEDGKTVFVKASKGEYLSFAQRVWKAGWNPYALSALGLYLPKKTTSGKEGGVDAKEAWGLFLASLKGLLATEDGRAKLEAARWTERDYQSYVGQLQADIVAYKEQYRQTESELTNLGSGKGRRKLETALKKVKTALEATTAEVIFLLDSAYSRIEQPLDLRLAYHVVCVGVEGRTFLTKEGRNRLDPVQPGLDPYTSTVFLVQVTIVTPSGAGKHYIFNTHKVDIKLLLPLLRLKRVTFAGANIKFDLKMLMHHAGFAPKDVYCVRVASRMLYLGLRMDHDLKSIAKRFIQRDLTKEVRNDFIGQRFEEPTPEMLAYAYVDTEVLPSIYDAQLKKAEGFGQVKLVHDFGRLSWITAHWEYTGYSVDGIRWMEINTDAAKDRDAVACELEKMLLPEGYNATFEVQPTEEAGEEPIDCDGDGEDDEAPSLDVRPNAVIRISQTKLVLERLEGLLKMGELGQYCPNGKASLSKDARAALEREYRKLHPTEGSHPFFQLYAKWAKLAKQVSTYGKRFLWYVHPLTGRIHPTFQIAGTDTGRYSSTGPNFLNIPTAKEEGDPDFRGAVLAPEGHLLLGGDLEAMELRIAGDISQDPAIQKMVLSGADAHKFSAASMFHLRREAVQAPIWRDEDVPYGTGRVSIEVLLVPRDFTDQQLIELAASPEVQAKVTKVTRTIAKMVGFLWLFRGTPYTLAQRTGMTEEACSDFFQRFETVYVRMSGHMNAIAETVYSNYIEGEDGNLYAWSEGYGGIRRWVKLPKNPHDRDYRIYGSYLAAAREYKRMMRRAQRELCNLPCQGGNAIITAEALLNVVERGSRLGVLPWLSIYDEIITVFPETANPVTVKALLESSVLEVADRYMTFVPAGFEADLEKVSKVWVKS